MNFTIGSLFDGSGGFPLAASMCGGTPVWASEVEPYPIAVTKTRFPYMKHLGSVTDIKGNEVEPVDVITFGSPCQDLSVAGKRAGLKHTDNGDEETTRSGLFMEAVRIIKEMREATNGEYPKFAVWENVPGAFSSNKGEDFRIVLEELIKVVEPSAVMPEVPKAGWPYADSYCGDGWSIAYRVLDAQFWGVPQRRRRIYLVLDLRGERAGEVLFEREGLRGYFETSRTPWQTATGDAETGVGTANHKRNCIIYTRGYGGVEQIPYTLKIRSGCEGGGKGALIQEDLSATLATNNDQYLFQPVTIEPGIASREGGHIYEGVSGTLRANAGDNRMAVAYALDQQGGKGNASYAVEVMPTLCSDSHGTPHAVAYPNIILDDQGGSQISVREDGKCPTLRAEMHGNVPSVMEPITFDARGNGDGKTVSTITGGHESSISDFTSIVLEPVYSLQGGGATSQNSQGCGYKKDTSFTLNTTDIHGVSYLASGKETVGTLMANAGTKLFLGNQEAFSGDYHIIEKHDIQYIVRRLTPTECARLQGFPDRWATPDKKDSFTDEEYEFWLNVRNTHAEINGKTVKSYSKDQMLIWYNKLHTDSAEYKLWGNGIALPCALYVMQGIADVMKGATKND